MAFSMRMVFAKTALYMWTKIAYNVKIDLHVIYVKEVILQMIECVFPVRIDSERTVMNVLQEVAHSARNHSLLVMASVSTVDLLKDANTRRICVNSLDV